MASPSEKKTRGRQKIEMKMIENPEDRLVTFSKRRSGIYKKLSEISALCGSEFLFICFSPAGNPFSFGHPSIETIANRYMNRNMPLSDNNNNNNNTLVMNRNMPMSDNNNNNNTLVMNRNMPMNDNNNTLVMNRNMPMNDNNNNNNTLVMNRNMPMNDNNNNNTLVMNRNMPMNDNNNNTTLVMNRNMPMNDNNNTLVEAHRMMKINELNEQYNEIERQLDVARQEEKVHAQQTGGRTSHYWWETPINQLNRRQLEELESRHAMFLNELYATRNKKIADISSMSTPMGPAQFDPFIAPSSVPAQFDPFIAPSSVPAQFDPFIAPSSVPAQFDPFIASSSVPAQFDPFIASSSVPARFTSPFIASSSTPALMDPAQFNNPFTANEDAFPPGHNHNPRQF